MEGRSNLTRWVLFAIAAFLFIQYGLPKITGSDKKSGETQPLGGLIDSSAPPDDKRKPEQTCSLEGPRFKAELSTRGASLRHVWLEGAKYTHEVEGKRVPIDLVTTTRESRMPLRTDLRTATGTADQVSYDDFDWELDKTSGKSACIFSYSDEHVSLRKEVAVTEHAFELVVNVTVENKSAQTRKHRFSIEQTDYRTKAEVEGSFGRVSEHLTHVEARAAGESHRLDAGSFEPDEFSEPEFTDEKWWHAAGEPKWAAVSNAYFSKAVFPLDGTPTAELLIEDYPEVGATYRSRLAYPLAELETGKSASYKVLAYLGPKERDALAAVGGGGREAEQIIDLGMFGVIGKVLIQYLYFLYGIVGTWGFAICLLTITVRVLLFPLTFAQIKSGMAMRKLKPQMDAINEKHKDDQQMKNLALAELWQKNKASHPAIGCIPVLLQMPVWFALYSGLQTAVELYHVPFVSAAFIPDLSAPDAFHAIPIVLGISSFVQQKLMPMQGDPMQQKMMMYMMPVIFTAMMFFMPAGLGIYFLTNTWLGIGQQLAVERFYKSRQAASGPSDEKKSEPASGALVKGKPRVQRG